MGFGTPARVGRSVRWGGVLMTVGVVQFVGAMAWAQSQYGGYSLLTNYISDLGNTSTSPLHDVFNVSIRILGILAALGILLGWSGFPRGGPRVIGLLLLLVASASAVVVGLYPENVNAPVHAVASLIVFLTGGLALVVLSAGMREWSYWSSYRGFSLLLGIIPLASLAYYAPTQLNNSTWDPGLIERLIVAPILLWGFAAGAHLVGLPRYSPGASKAPV